MGNRGAHQIRESRDVHKIIRIYIDEQIVHRPWASIREWRGRVEL